MAEKKILPPDFDPMNVEKTSSEFLKTANCLNFNFHVGEVFYLDFDYEQLSKPVTPDDDNPLGIQEVSIKINRQVVETTRIESKAEILTEQLQDIEHLKKYNISGLDYLITSTNNDYTSKVEKDLCELYDKLSLQSKEENLSDYHRFMRKWFGIKYFVYAETPTNLITKMFLHSNLIAVSSRKGPANFAIVDLQTATLLQDDPRFVYNSNVPQGYSVSTIYPIGNVGAIRVYVNPYVRYNDGRIILGKTTGSQDTGVVFGEYQKHIENYEDQLNRKTVFSIVSGICIKEIGKYAHRNYIQFNVLYEKRPWWRKLFKL